MFQTLSGVFATLDLISLLPSRPNTPYFMTIIRQVSLLKISGLCDQLQVPFVLRRRNFNDPLNLISTMIIRTVIYVLLFILIF